MSRFSHHLSSNEHSFLRLDLPLKLDLTQVLVDYKRFERSVIWYEFWHGRQKEEIDKPIFTKQKDNLPRNYAVPEAVSSIIYFGPACLRPAFLAGSFYVAHFDPAKKAVLNKYIQVKKW